MTLKERIGYDAGTTRLEDALSTAAEHGFHYLDFNADQGPNRLTEWERRTGWRRLMRTAGDADDVP